MKLTSDPSVATVFDQYPDHIKRIMEQLRKLVIETAESVEGIDKVVESLKWGEPSYRSNHGSTIRMDWKPKNPDYCALYFQCTTSLVSTYRVVFGEELKFEGKRAILLDVKEALPEQILKQCLTMAINYHRVKHLPLLGA
ncbi:MAG: DUF1801 domain-containing protein [Cyclobacteriaceae bacterium]